MPNRIIKESICSSDSLDELTWQQECFWFRLIVNCDDYGRMDARPEVLRSKLYQNKKKLSTKEISATLQKMLSLGLIGLYEVDGKPYLHIPTWLEHQTPRAKRSKYPAPDDMNAHEIICNHMQADAVYIRDTIFDNRYSRSDIREYPTLDDVKAYFAEKGLTIDAQHFFTYYDEADWKDKDGKPVKNWKQKALTWQAHEKPKPASKTPIAPAQKVTKEEFERNKRLLAELKGEIESA